MIAASKGSSDMVKLLLEEGASVNKRDKRSKTAIYHAIDNERGENLHVISLLLEKHADVNYECSDQSPTPLIKAIERSHLKTVKMLLSNKADINMPNSTTGNTPLHCASKGNSLPIIKELITRHADTNARNKKGKYPHEMVSNDDIAKFYKSFGSGIFNSHYRD